MADTVVILTSGSSWTVPADWNPAANTIEAIGGGAAGGASVGGTGADYAKVSNQSLSGSIAISIGAAGASGGNGGDTTFGSILLAKGGGSASTDIGSTTYAGGTTTTAGGGGAAGSSGAGGNASGNTGGTGDNGTVPADASGTEWGTAGSGGGGSSGFSDNFATPASATNWAMSLQGTAGGTYAFNTGNMTMTPKASAINSVAMQHAGSFKNIAATVKLTTNPGALQYHTLSIGSGAIIPHGSGSWWYTTFTNGYALEIQASGAMALYKVVGGVFTVLGSGPSGTVSPGSTNVYGIVITGTGVTPMLNGTGIVGEIKDTTYSSGGILIAQGEYTNGAGGIATVTQVTAS
jgi:hypothetical protein